MKKKTINIIFTVATVLVFVILTSISIIKFCIASYGSGYETVSDVVKVNTGTEYVLLSNEDKYQIFLASDHWNCLNALESHGYHHVDTMGTGTFYENDQGNHICLVATDQWCKLFHEYTISGINCDARIQDILSGD